AAFLQAKDADDLVLQVSVFRGILQGMSQRGEKLSLDRPMGRWGAALAEKLLANDKAAAGGWTKLPSDPARPSPSPWGVRVRACADGRKDVVFFDSIVGGES